MKFDGRFAKVLVGFVHFLLVLLTLAMTNGSTEECDMLCKAFV